MGKKNSNASKDSELLAIAAENASGWNLEDLKKVRTAAQELKCIKSTARIKASAKIAMIAGASAVESLAKQIFNFNPSTKLLRENAEYISVEISANFQLPKLPASYGFKGGAARLALAHVLGEDVLKVVPRDIDLVRFAKGSLKQDRLLAEKIMPEDFSHGHGVEVVGGLSDYLSSRDLTINQVLLLGKKLIFTKQALCDLKSGIIRPLPNLLKLSQFPGKIACKMLRLAAENKVAGRKYELVDFPYGLKIRSQDIKLHQLRAREQDEKIEFEYLELCKEMLCLDVFSPVAKPNPRAFRALPLRNVLRLPQKHS